MLTVYILIALIMLASTYVVITARNLVYAVFFLILVYLGGMLYLVFLDAEFVAVMLLLVYVGAIAILFLFVTMTLNVSLLHSILRSHLVVRSFGGFVGFVEMVWGFLFDTLTMIMCSLVIIVSLTVHLYSLMYMEEDPSLVRFLSYLSLFTFFMLILVTSYNFLQLFVGWEGVGLCSYLLINFWYTRVQANMAAIKAILVNRVGDFGLLLGMVLSLDFVVVFSLVKILVQKLKNVFVYIKKVCWNLNFTSSVICIENWLLC